MSSRFLLALLLVGSAPLAAQDRWEVPAPILRQRLVNLKARRAVLQAEVARDSLRRFHQALVPVGRPPLTLLVPAWAAEESGSRMETLLADWEERIGPLLQRAPAETLAVPYMADTTGLPRDMIDATISDHPAVILFNADKALVQRVRREIGAALLQWLGEELPSARPGAARRDGILALLRDTTGAGAQCLEGAAVSCLEMLRRGDRDGFQVRRAFLDWAVARTGQEGWTRLAADTTIGPEARVVALVGGEPVTAAGSWISALRDPHRATEGSLAGFHLLAIVWAAGLFLLFLWRLTWHRA